ncbi:hypothetical protein ACQKII_05425 [Lysinibacillus sp. NPDC048646]|uniref:hypothetical protein n=1 Tax=Lysinibacillus sp. NPDC048646 TaxID=3390574 RepID=UPI003D04A319
MEKICLELENIEVTFFEKEIIIIDVIDRLLHQFDCIGIVGDNGVGKSTLNMQFQLSAQKLQRV